QHRRIARLKVSLDLAAIVSDVAQLDAIVGEREIEKRPPRRIFRRQSDDVRNRIRRQRRRKLGGRRQRRRYQRANHYGQRPVTMESHGLTGLLVLALRAGLRISRHKSMKSAYLPKFCATSAVGSRVECT